MRKGVFGIVAALVVITALAGTSQATEHDAESFDPNASHVDFWKQAAQETSYAPYRPARKSITAAGLEAPERPPFELAMVMICPGEWNITADYPIAGSDESLSVYQAPSDECWPDFGASGAPGQPSSFKASGGSFTLKYMGCASTPVGADEPAADQCAQADREYDVYGSWPKRKGRSNPTAMHLSTTGTSVPEIKAFVRSMRPVR